MTKKWVKRFRFLSIASIILIAFFGAITLWADSYFFKNYFDQYSKYNSIQEGMTKEQVQSIMKVSPTAKSVNEYTYTGDFDEVFIYPIALEYEYPHYVVVFYMQGQVVGKQAYSQQIPIFSAKEFNDMKEAPARVLRRLILMMSLGLAGGIAWLIIFPRYEVIQKKGAKKFWIGVLLGICFVISLGIMIIMGLIVLQDTHGVLSISEQKNYYNILFLLSCI